MLFLRLVHSPFNLLTSCGEEGHHSVVHDVVLRVGGSDLSSTARWMASNRPPKPSNPTRTQPAPNPHQPHTMAFFFLFFFYYFILFYFPPLYYCVGFFTSFGAMQSTEPTPTQPNPNWTRSKPAPSTFFLFLLCRVKDGGLFKKKKKNFL